MKIKHCPQCGCDLFPKKKDAGMSKDDAIRLGIEALRDRKADMGTTTEAAQCARAIRILKCLL